MRSFLSSTSKLSDVADVNENIWSKNYSGVFCLR